eukprot:CAMPEP_0197701582 /NCGR_PEP_ID=MMETSP1338-20131121/123431_1 /TAXON_ID=43686 ORGANISM="Pelagodinium beii, Strain RCC1491" /NCGR_SAMPLE_ID=MMETSP1338 /ASSEMBLY_ACC=CAM_ASM_000754 /LENGTH=384 /DNA_ID=CAMNT_0043285297 /DNA_START=42 /DNA_END=1196 /DNA_ORIENTATION=+
MSKAQHLNKWQAAKVKMDAIYKLKHSAHVLHMGLPDGHNITVHSQEHLEAVEEEERSIKSLLKRAVTKHHIEDDKETPKFWPAAVASVALGVASVVPYNMVLKGDPGSPLFISFALHLAIIFKGLPHAGKLIRDRGIPLKYHAAIVFLGCMFTTLKSDAYVRLPASLCMMLSNLRMIVGVVVQYVIFKKKYSISQLCGVATVTVGIVWASQAMQSAKTSGAAASASVAASDFTVGCVEVFGSSVSLALLSSAVKIAFEKYGERVEEQIFIQHLVSLPLVFPSQWDKVGPRMLDWFNRRDLWLISNLLASVGSTFVARNAAAQMAGRSPNLLMTQLVQTLECFLQLLVVAFLRVPPWPPLGFWGGAVVLVLGTLHYLRASAAPPR